MSGVQTFVAGVSPRNFSCNWEATRQLGTLACPCRVSISLSSSRSLFHSRVLSTTSAEVRPKKNGVVCMVLPTANPVLEGQGTGPQGQAAWSARAIKSFSMAELEARKLKYPNTGTEALLMGILTEGTSRAARFLRVSGITLFGVREEIVKLLGKADMYFFSPEHPPLTEQAQNALDWAVEDSGRLGAGGEVTTTCMLLGIWAQKGSAGQKVLETLGFDDDKATEVRELASKSAYD